MKAPFCESPMNDDSATRHYFLRIIDEYSMNAQVLASELASKVLCNYAALLNVDRVELASAEKHIVYEDGKLKLYRLKAIEGVQQRCVTPVLMVYALVNRPSMLDLQPDRSLIRNLLAQGLDVYIIDWGYPSKADKYVTLDDYVDGYIDGCVNHILATTGLSNVNIVGICQGGTLATIYATLYPQKVRTLIPIATPIDFSSSEGLLFEWAKTMDIDAIVDGFGVVPDAFMNVGFMMIKPFARLEKYAAALDMYDAPDKLMNFLRMEEWIFDSPAQAGECLRQFVKDLYKENAFVKGTLNIGGKIAHLSNITMPLLNVYASADHIVPPSATLPLNDYVASTDTMFHEMSGGHIGIFVGAKAQRELAPAIAEWLVQRDVPADERRSTKNVQTFPTVIQSARAATKKTAQPVSATSAASAANNIL
jgi:polyhydroxyalkanoate synthase